MGNICHVRCAEQSFHARIPAGNMDELFTMYIHSCEHPEITTKHIEASSAAHCEENVTFLMYYDILQCDPDNSAFVHWLIRSVVPDLNLSHSARIDAIKGNLGPARKEVYMMLKCNGIMHM